MRRWVLCAVPLAVLRAPFPAALSLMEQRATVRCQRPRRLKVAREVAREVGREVARAVAREVARAVAGVANTSQVEGGRPAHLMALSMAPMSQLRASVASDVLSSSVRRRQMASLAGEG